jgi:hypothetical protein
MIEKPERLRRPIHLWKTEWAQLYCKLDVMPDYSYHKVPAWKRTTQQSYSSAKHGG